MKTALALACCLALPFDYAQGTPNGSRGVQSLGATQERAHITRIEFRPATVEEGGGILISLVGKGNCTYTIDFGDGQSERRTADLPDSLRHQYAPDRAYDVVATPEPPCEGVARARIDVRGIERGIWGVRAELASATAPEIVVILSGKGACSVVVDFGDGESEKRDVELPAKVNHKYVKGGAYEIHARALEPCRGEGRVRIEITTQALHSPSITSGANSASSARSTKSSRAAVAGESSSPASAVLTSARSARR
jgi:hypothetical protein